MRGSPEQKSGGLRRVLNIVNLECVFFAFLIGMTLLNWNFPALICLGVGIGMIVLFQWSFRQRISYLIVTGLFSLYWTWCFSASWFVSGFSLIGALIAAGSLAAFLFCHVQMMDEHLRNHES